MKPAHAVFVSASLPPQWDSQTIRSLYLLSCSAEFPVRFTFVSPAAAVESDHPCAELVPAGTNVVVTDPAPFTKRVESIKRRLGRRAAWFYSNVYYRTAVPDALAGWDKMAEAKMVEVHESDPADVVLSASGSPTAHMAASSFARRYRLPWVADYGDPWSILDRKHRPFAALRSDVLESDTLANCSHVVFTTEATLDAYRLWLGDSLPPASVLPYGFRAVETSAIGHSCNGGRLTVGHIGVAFRGNRNLVPLITSLKSRDDQYRLEVVGNHSPIFETEAKGLTGAKFRDRVGYDEAAVAMAESDVLVVIGNKAPLQVPGKSYVCMGTQKVVLYIGQRDETSDPTYGVLGKLPGVIACRNEKDEIGSALDRIQKDWSQLREAAISRVELPEVQAVEAASLSRRYLSTVLEVVGQR